MFIRFNLGVLILVLTLQDQVHTGEIIGGHEAVPHSRPYMVLLERHMSNGKKMHCDGFLLSEDFVMTAAHCHAESYKIYLGLHNYYKKNDVQQLTVPGKNAFPNRDYNKTDYRNDIMLLKLSSKAKFTDNVKPIVLADRDFGSLPQSCVVSGWGRTENSMHMSLNLLEVDVTLVENKQCAEENKYCSEGKKGPGEGDSGGPLVCEDGKAYGVVCANMQNPDGLTVYGYTKIPDNSDWIDFIMKKHN
ncbi:granzyme B(G,H)-like [Archocentrus centrarchus]|uniref:granzyme B(G,H)-like n=1 Tax=Archocentrus centrarchus TaxID=63155 RepID=UPI0011EA331C|nr:granzyme B(G,H)-like [Archocentrus centrarchus]